MNLRLSRSIERFFDAAAMISFSLAGALLLYKIVHWLLKDSSPTFPSGPSFIYVVIFAAIGIWFSIFNHPRSGYVHKKERAAQGISGIQHPLQALDMLQELRNEDGERIAEIAQALIEMKEFSKPEVWNHLIAGKEKKLNEFLELLETKRKEAEDTLAKSIQASEMLLARDGLLSEGSRKRMEDVVSKGKQDLGETKKKEEEE
jgi:uncharacterized protein YhaN